MDDSLLIVDILKKGVVFDKEKGIFTESEDPEDYIETDLDDDIRRKEIEILTAMNYINSDLKFTTETERDFGNKRLPTLSFQCWSDITVIRHSYYENEMGSQFLTHKCSSQSEHSKYSILVNELQRRFDVKDGDIDLEEQVQIVDHYCQQLLHSGYQQDQIRDLIESGLKGVIRKEKHRQEQETRFRSGSETIEERERKKLLESTSWYRDKINDNSDETVEADKFKVKGKHGTWRGVKRQSHIKSQVTTIDVNGKP